VLETDKGYFLIYKPGMKKILPATVKSLYKIIKKNTPSIDQMAQKVKILTVICRLETYIGNNVDWKHKNRLET